MDPITGGALASGASQIVSSLLGNASRARQNRKSRTFARGMYEKQYQDNIEFWRMQNSYNDPSQQRKRLEKAGLNPALMYGQNAGGASGNAGSIASPKVVNPEFNPADWSGVGAGITSTINSMYDLRVKRNTANNLARQNDLLQEQKQLVAAQTFKTLTEGKTGALNYKLQDKLFGINLQAAEEALRKLTVEADSVRDANMRQETLFPTVNAAAIEDLAIKRINKVFSGVQVQKARAELKNILKDGKIKDFEIMLNDMGLTRGSGTYVRLIGIWLDDVVNKIKYHMKNADSKLKK